MTRWHRVRQLVLVAIVGAALLGLIPERPPPPEPVVVSVDPRPAPSARWIPLTTSLDGDGSRILEPAIEKGDDGTLVAHDRLREEQIVLHVDDGPASVELALREWATRICEPEPRPIYLLRFEDEHTVDRLSQLLVDACPGFQVHHTRFRCWCGGVGPPWHPH